MINRYIRNVECPNQYTKVFSNIKLLDFNKNVCNKKIKTHLLIKRSDYRDSQIVGAKEVKKYGGKILRAKTLKNFSSSIIIDEILNTSF